MPAADVAEERVVVALVGAHVRAGLLDLVQVPADVAHVVHDERAVAEQHAEELRVAGAQDDALQQVVEAEGRVGHARLQEHHAEPRDGVDRRKPEHRSSRRTTPPTGRAATALSTEAQAGVRARPNTDPRYDRRGSAPEPRQGAAPQARATHRARRAQRAALPGLDRAIVGRRLDRRASRDSACRPARAGRSAATRHGRAACRCPSRCRCRARSLRRRRRCCRSRPGRCG